MNVADWRAEIDKVDDELMALLNRRAQLAAALAEIKSGAGQPLHDSSRESEVIKRACLGCLPPLDEIAVRRIFTCILQESRRMLAPFFIAEGSDSESDVQQTEPAAQSF
jgi:chorismate mutase